MVTPYGPTTLPCAINSALHTICSAGRGLRIRYDDGTSGWEKHLLTSPELVRWIAKPPEAEVTSTIEMEGCTGEDCHTEGIVQDQGHLEKEEGRAGEEGPARCSVMTTTNVFEAAAAPDSDGGNGEAAAVADGGSGNVEAAIAPGGGNNDRPSTMLSDAARSAHDFQPSTALSACI